MELKSTLKNSPLRANTESCWYQIKNYFKQIILNEKGQLFFNFSIIFARKVWYRFSFFPNVYFLLARSMAKLWQYMQYIAIKSWASNLHIRFVRKKGKSFAFNLAYGRHEFCKASFHFETIPFRHKKRFMQRMLKVMSVTISSRFCCYSFSLQTCFLERKYRGPLIVFFFFNFLGIRFYFTASLYLVLRSV